MNRRHITQSLSSTKRSAVVPGTPVSIVLKCDQRTGKQTHGVVQSVLTNSANHPRGIKVRLTTGQVGRVQHIQSRSSSTGVNATYSTPAELAPNPPLGFSLHDHHRDSRQTGRTLLGDWFPPLGVATQHNVQSPFIETLDHESRFSSVVPWRCSVCTYDNVNLVLECEVCMTARDQN